MIGYVKMSLLALGLMMLAAPAMAQSKAPLREVAKVDNELFYIAVANDEIDENCDSLRGRRLKAINVMWNLRSHANKLGYTDAEIRAYVDSDAEKDRMRAKGERYLKANGVNYNKPESFCALGQSEMARNSAIGVYLRAR